MALLRHRRQFLRQSLLFENEVAPRLGTTYNNITCNATTATLNLLCKTSPFKAASFDRKPLPDRLL